MAGQQYLLVELILAKTKVSNIQLILEHKYYLIAKLISKIKTMKGVVFSPQIII